MSVSFNWFRRTLHNTSSTVNRALNPTADWSPISIINPIDGSAIPAYRINANKVSVTPDLLLTNSDPDLRRLSYHGFELGTSARLPRRTLLFAGWTFERTVDVDCTMSTNISNTLGGQSNVAGTLNDPNSLRFCDMSGGMFQELGQSPDVPFRHEFKVNASVPLWYGFEASGSFQSYPGQLKANTPFPAPDAPGLSWTITPGSTTYPTDCTFPGCSGVVLPSRRGSRRRSIDRVAARAAGQTVHAALEPGGLRAQEKLQRRPHPFAGATGSVQRLQREHRPDQRDRAVHQAQSLRSGDNTAGHRAELHVRVGRRLKRRDAEQHTESAVGSHRGPDQV